MSTDLLSDHDAEALRRRIEVARLIQDRRLGQKFYRFFPDEGPLCRGAYPKHMEFFAAGAFFPERLFMAANRVGKSEAGAFELTCHLTGLYPSWWQGKRFSEPIEAWACGTTSETTRDIVQGKLLGPWDRPLDDLGMIPQHLIGITTPRPHGLRGSIEAVRVKHVSGGWSLLGFKTYEQGRKSFEGTSKRVIWDDEEPPEDVYQEQLLRTLDCGGIMLVTFTPLQGMSEVVMGFVEPSDAAADVKMFVQAGWDDVPHLDEGQKKRKLATMLPYQIAARTKGEPGLGAGAIYPIPEADITIPARSFPTTWPRGYGMDVGWNRTAAIFATQDVSNGIYYFYDEHYMSVGEPTSHANAIRARGLYLEGAIDPASHGRSQIDGRRLFDQYQQLGLQLHMADNAVEAGIMTVWTLLIEGRLKVCANCTNWLAEFRKYHRDEKGNIVKKNDHILDACLAPDTMVLTSEGPLRIADLVGREGHVVSRDGAMAAYLGARLVFRDVPVVRVEFDGGASVTCTPDHPFLTPKGWLRADEMLGEQGYNAIWQQSLTPSFSLPRVRSSVVAAITSAANTSSAMATAFIAWCGKRIMGRSQMATMCTTSTMIAGTTPSAISLYWRPESTSVTTSAESVDPSRQRRTRPQPSGTDQVKDESGTDNTTRTTASSSTSRSGSPASRAVLGSSRKSRGATSSAPTSARRGRAWRLVLTMYNGIAWGAARLSWQIATKGKSTARDRALSRVSAVSVAGRSDVYCLTVPGLSAFAVEHGVVVHNTRYWAQTGRDHMKVAPKAERKREPEQRGGRTWMAS